MVWQEETRVIVMTTKETERDRPKCKTPNFIKNNLQINSTAVLVQELCIDSKFGKNLHNS